MIEYYQRSNCRLCLHDSLRVILELVPTPIGDAFVAREQCDTAQRVFPLTLYQCCSCGHAQLRDVVAPELLFGEYTFRTKSSGGLVEHFRRFANQLSERFSLGNQSKILEIGSNDGTLLKFFKERGMTVLGVDPATTIAHEATQSGIPTVPKFFTSQGALDIRDSFGKVDLLCANNVFAHVDDLRDITVGIKQLLLPHGVFVFEVSHLVDILERKLFDTIYHEHLCYHSVKPLKSFFESFELELFDVENVTTKGGSIRCFVQHVGGAHSKSERLNAVMAAEEAKAIHTPAPFLRLSQELEAGRKSLFISLKRFKEAGRPIIGFGASVTTTTLIYFFELTTLLDGIVDDNPFKNGLFSPGAHIPVHASQSLYGMNPPPVVVILAWNYAEPIIKKHASLQAEGATFIVPLPEPRIVGG